jgi:Ca2+-transporting ATPase
MFNVTPFCLRDWLVIILGTSPVLIIGEIIRLVGRRKASQRL